MAWYHSGIGFFVNTTLTMASVYLAVWLTFLFALSNALAVRNGEEGLVSAINTVQIVQLGLLSIIPYWGELALESGIINVRSPLSAACAFCPIAQCVCRSSCQCHRGLESNRRSEQ
jgi:hypothetical protein